MNIESAVLLLISLSMLIYLVFALLRPEKFSAMTANGWFQSRFFLR